MACIVLTNVHLKPSSTGTRMLYVKFRNNLKLINTSQVVKEQCIVCTALTYRKIHKQEIWIQCSNAGFINVIMVQICLSYFCYKF